MPPISVNVQANQSALVNSIAQGVATFNNRMAGKNQLNLHINAKAFSRPLGAISNNLRQFEQSLAASNARVIAFGASTAVIGGVAKTFKDLVSVTIEVEKALTDVNRVFGLSTENLQRFSKELFTISRQTASSFAAVAEAALEFSRQGLSTEETLRRVNDALVLTRLTGMSTSKAVEELTAVVNAYSDSALNTSEVLNKIVAVEQRFAVSAADLTVAVSRTGQAAQEAGVNFDELNALVTAVQERTARGGAVIGNALKTIFTRLGRSETLDQLEQFNIAVRDLGGNTLPAVQILENLANSYETLSDTTKSALAEQVAGVYQVNILKSLLSDLSDRNSAYSRSLDIGRRATNEATIANAQLNTTLSALLSQTGTDLVRFGNNIGKVTFDPVFRNLIKPFDDAVVYLNKLLEGETLGSDFAGGLLKGVRNVLAGPGLLAATTIIFRLVQNTFKDVTSALPSILGITTETQKRKNLEESILGVLTSQTGVSRELWNQNGNLIGQQQLLLNLAREQTSQYLYQVELSRKLAGGLFSSGVRSDPKMGLGFQVGKKYGGFVPNFSSGNVPSSLRSQEIRGAIAGGYTPGAVIPAPKSVGGVMNSAEKVKYVGGFSQPFINPPINSRAGISHRIKSISTVGVDPYRNSGYIPKTSASGSLPPFDITGTSLSGSSGKAVSFKKINAAINSYLKNTELASKSNFDLSNELESIILTLKLSKDSFSKVYSASLAFAKKQRDTIITLDSISKTKNAMSKAIENIAATKSSRNAISSAVENTRALSGARGAISAAAKNTEALAEARGAIVIAAKKAERNKQIAQKAKELEEKTLASTNRLAEISRQIEVEKLKELETQKLRNARTSALQKQFLDASRQNTLAVVSTAAIATKTAEAQKTQGKFKSSLNKFGKGIQDSAIPISFALPMLTGFLEQGVFGNRSRLDMSSKERGAQSFLSTGVSTIGTSALIGGSFGGPPGAGIGAAIGAIIALSVAATDAKLSLEELTEINNKQRQQNQETVANASSYISSKKELSSLILSGASANEITLATQKLKQNFLDIKDTNLQKMFEEAGENVDQMSLKLSEYTKKLSSETSFKDFVYGSKLNSKESALSLVAGIGESPEKLKQAQTIISKAKLAKDEMDRLQLNIDNAQGVLSLRQAEGERNAIYPKKSQEFSSSLSSLLELGGFESGTKEFDRAFSELRSTISKVGLDKLIKQVNDIAKISKDNEASNKKSITETANLFNLRTKLTEETSRESNKIIVQLKNNDFTRKLEKDLFDFRSDLSESFTAPLERIRAKLDFQSQNLEKEYLDEVSKLNNEFASKTFKDIKDKITNPFALQRTSKALEGARSGDFSGVDSLLNSERFQKTVGPSGFVEFKNAVIEYKRSLEEAQQNNANQQKSNKQAADLETIRSNVVKRASELLQEEAGIIGRRERSEILRKTNIELEIDAIERAASDPASMLGRGVEGKAAERNKYRNMLLQKKLQDDEITKSRTAQQEYSKVLESQREVLLNRSADSKNADDAEKYLKQANQLLPIELKSREDIQKAVEQISKISFTDNKQEESRLQTLEALKTVQEEILAGKTKEEEITKRINQEETRNAKRSRSFGYGLATGFDEIRDEVDTFENRLGQILPNTFRDGIVGALDAAINKTDDLNEAMLEVASSFLRTIQNAMFEQIAGTIVSGAGSLMKRQRGGVIRAQNGMYISGGRTGDKNPALLEDGEYVLNRNAVKAFGGPSVLNQLNFGSFPRFANGGANVSINEPFTNLSQFGRENSPEYQNYIDRLREAEAIKEAKKAKEKALINQLISTAITSAVAVGFGSISRGGVNGVRGASNPIKTPQTSPYSGNTALVQAGGLMRFNSGGYLPYGNRLNDTIPAMLSGGEYIVNSSAVRKYGVGGLNRINAGVARYQDGGLVGPSSSPNVGNTSSTNANNVSINITINSSGGKVENEQTNVSGARNEDGNAKLAGKIKEVVLQVITDQQRTGGLLETSKKR